MKHSAIASAVAQTAITAARYAGVSRVPFDTANLAALYCYARERKFPAPETLARKIGQETGDPFPYASIAEAPEAAQVFFTAFHALAQALEPFNLEDDSSSGKLLLTDPSEGPLFDAIALAGAKDIEDLVDMAKVGRSLMNAIGVHVSQKDDPLHNWAPADDPAEVVGDLVEMVIQANEEIGLLSEGKKALDAKLAELEKEKPMNIPDEPKKPDDVATRTAEGQKAMDAAIAESGGQFSKPTAPAEKEETAKKKTK